jgi:acyl transferase domain-containing protein
LGHGDLGHGDLGYGDLGHGDLGPVQKLATEMTALALTDAGLREGAGHSRTGMIIASTAPGLGDLVSSQLGFAASGPYPPAARTSSLHAVTAAAAALQAGELDLAIAGGAELGLDPVWLTLQARAGTLGTDEMRVYAADPAGLLPGEGCGVVILVRSADARAAGVPVYAEIAGWNAVPAGPPELAGPALEQAYQRAGADPADIQYIEGQGTGTAAGDSAELAAFSRLRRDTQVTAALGAASASIGYTRAAAGIASLIRTAAAMAAGTIPPGPGCARPHPLITSGDARLRLPGGAEPWPDGDPDTARPSGGTGSCCAGRRRAIAGPRGGGARPRRVLRKPSLRSTGRRGNTRHRAGRRPRQPGPGRRETGERETRRRGTGGAVTARRRCGSR